MARKTTATANTESPAVCTCGEAVALHIGGKPCVLGKPSQARSLHDLPIFGWTWHEDGRDLHA